MAIEVGECGSTKEVRTLLAMAPRCTKVVHSVCRTLYVHLRFGAFWGRARRAYARDR